MKAAGKIRQKRRDSGKQQQKKHILETWSPCCLLKNYKKQIQAASSDRESKDTQGHFSYAHSKSMHDRHAQDPLQVGILSAHTRQV